MHGGGANGAFGAATQTATLTTTTQMTPTAAMRGEAFRMWWRWQRARAAVASLALVNVCARACANVVPIAETITAVTIPIATT